MSSLFAFLFIIGLLVFVHELGHFAVAKWCGVKVEQFSLGFGPSLVSFSRGETEYKLCVLPFGGYVQMAGEGGGGAVFVENTRGETPFEKGDRIISIDGEDVDGDSSWNVISAPLRGRREEIEFSVTRKDSDISFSATSEQIGRVEAYAESEYPRAFSNKSVSRRMAIVTAGPLMNFLLPFLLLPVAFMSGVAVPAYTESEPVAVKSAGEVIRTGDRIVSVDGKAVATWSEVSSALRGADGEARLEIERKNGKREVVETARENISPVLMAEIREPVIGSVAAGSPAAKAGVKAGDRVLNVAGGGVKDWDSMAGVIRQNAGKEISLTLERNGDKVKTLVVPAAAPGARKAIIGVTLKRDETIKKFGFVESVTGGVSRAAEMVIQVVSLFFALLFSLIGGEMSLGQAGKTVAGPLFIAKMSGAMAQQGIAALLMFASFISVNLAVVNLLPIPVLDGGHIVYLGIESARGKPLSRGTLETAQRIGFSLLITIMIIATFNDVSNLWGEISEFLKNLVSRVE